MIGWQLCFDLQSRSDVGIKPVHENKRQCEHLSINTIWLWFPISTIDGETCDVLLWVGCIFSTWRPWEHMYPVCFNKRFSTLANLAIDCGACATYFVRRLCSLKSTTPFLQCRRSWNFVSLDVKFQKMSFLVENSPQAFFCAGKC